MAAAGNPVTPSASASISGPPCAILSEREQHLALHSTEPLTLVFGTNALEKKYLPVHPDLFCAHSGLFRAIHDKADENGRIEGLPVSAYPKNIKYLDYLNHPGRDVERHVKRQVRGEMDIWNPEDTEEKQFCEVVRRLSEMWLLGRGFEDVELQNSAMTGLLKQNVRGFPVEMQMLAREIVDCEELRWTELYGWFVHAIGATVEERDLRGAAGPVGRWSRELLVDVLGEVIEYQARSHRAVPGISDRTAYMVGGKESEENQHERKDSVLAEGKIRGKSGMGYLNDG
ncbi:hypothetical protein AC578_9721 [Pseudocercospora eumusae]|uniref:BTB domain-containing protein n=1 Tax=Pseudocercospora eumusae TaxID=321146 RepID=A0A139HR01_9PEZI|nr:hypothetical protein AC578_9721 [Pseudocercospora eumusae]